MTHGDLSPSPPTAGLAADPERIGIVGWSLGGYYAPRALAFEKRLKLGVAWGANHDWFEVQEGRRRREGENPVPHYWDHVFWVWGASDMDDFIEKTRGMHLNGVAEHISIDNMSYVAGIIADWVAETFHELAASRSA